MPLIQSAIKRARQNDVRRRRLLPYRTQMKTMIRKVTDLTKEGKTKEAVALLPSVYQSIDTATKKNVIHRKTAARKKSLVARMVTQGATK
jgi:small subunit ribosomal protein S20